MGKTTKFDMFQGKDVLITGGLGFIGSNLSIELARNRCHVTILDSLVPEFWGYISNISPVQNEVRVNISDMRDPFPLKILVAHK